MQREIKRDLYSIKNMEKPHIQRTTEMPETFRLVKENLLREFPKENIEGINTQRVEEFIKKEGLEVKPYIVVEKEDLSRVRDICGSTNLLRGALERGYQGIYLAEIDLALVVRERDYEKMNGVIFTERRLIHELSHASSKFQTLVMSETMNDSGITQSFYTSRVGFCMPQNKTPWGVMFEEGWAEMCATDYFVQHATEDDKDRLRKALGFGRLDLEDTIPMRPSSSEENRVLPVPIKYIYLRPDGMPTSSLPVFAACAIEILCEKNQALSNLLIEARASTDGLRKVAREVGRMAPELYKFLQTSNYSEQDFFERLGVVINKVGGGIENVIKAKGTLKDKWDKILKR